MTRFLNLLVVVLASAAVSVTNAQFTCTLTNQDEDSCLKMIGDDSEHCVWCNLASFGFCVGEQQAEQMEQALPGVACDRFSGTDDAAPATDDATPATDDATPKTDDATPKTDDATPPPSDDSLPDDFWTCLQKKDSKSCLAASCTWCDSNEYKFGVCMTGPTADSASDSTFFTCTAAAAASNYGNVDEVVASDPSDPSCLTAYLEDPTQEGCTAAVDAQGNPCEWCSLADMANLCLTAEQADLANPLGITCQEESIVTSLLRGVGLKTHVQDPLDTACLVAFLQDPTETGCKAAVDSDGNACEFCDLQGQYQLCLNEEQAQFGEQVGMECGNDSAVLEEQDVADPMDPSCLLSYLQDPTEEGCKAAIDSDGNGCEFCSLQQYQLCLNAEQAMYGQQMGMECSLSSSAVNHLDDLEDPLDPACLEAFLQDPTEDGCHAAVDSDGNACEFCTLQGQYQLCLNEEQAMYGEQIGMECSENSSSSSNKNSHVAQEFLAEEATLLATASE